MCWTRLWPFWPRGRALTRRAGRPWTLPACPASRRAHLQSPAQPLAALALSALPRAWAQLLVSCAACNEWRRSSHPTACPASLLSRSAWARTAPMSCPRSYGVQTLKIVRYTTRLLLATALRDSGGGELAQRLKRFEGSIATSRRGGPGSPCGSSPRQRRWHVRAARRSLLHARLLGSVAESRGADGRRPAAIAATGAPLVPAPLAGRRTAWASSWAASTRCARRRCTRPTAPWSGSPRAASASTTSQTS